MTVGVATAASVGRHTAVDVDPLNIPSAPHNVSSWRTETHKLCAESSMARQRSSNLRDRCLSERRNAVFTEQRTRQPAVDAFLSQTESYKQAIEALETAQTQLTGQIAAERNSVYNLGRAMAHGAQPLAVSQARLNVRMARPEREQVSDGAENALVQEVTVLVGNMNSLQSEQMQDGSDLNDLLLLHQELMRDQQSKTLVLNLDTKCLQAQRTANGVLRAAPFTKLEGNVASCEWEQFKLKSLQKAREDCPFRQRILTFLYE